MERWRHAISVETLIRKENFESRNMVLVIGDHFRVRNKGGYKREQQQKATESKSIFNCISFLWWSTLAAVVFRLVVEKRKNKNETDKIICIDVLWWMASIQLQKNIFNFQWFSLHNKGDSDILFCTPVLHAQWVKENAKFLMFIVQFPLRIMVQFVRLVRTLTM